MSKLYFARPVDLVRAVEALHARAEHGGLLRPRVLLRVGGRSRCGGRRCAASFLCLSHGSPPSPLPLAVIAASMIRTKVPQRQMLPSSPFFTCSARRLRMLLEERDGRHDEARRAEAAHQRVAIAERLLHGMQRRAVRRDRRRCESACPAPRSRASSTSTRCVPSTIIVQAPHDAAIAARACCRSGRRGCGSHSSSVTRGSIAKLDALAVDHQLDRHVAGSDDRRDRSARGPRRRPQRSPRAARHPLPSGTAASSIDRLGSSPDLCSLPCEPASNEKGHENRPSIAPGPFRR